MVPLVLAVATTLGGDYRLEVKGSLCLVIAGILTGIAMSLRSYQQEIPAPLQGVQISICGLVLCCAFIPLNEHLFAADIRSLGTRTCFYLLVNAASTSIALSTRGSIFVMHTAPHPLHFALVPIGFLSLVGCLDQMSSQFSYATVIQLSSFSVASITLVYLRSSQLDSIDRTEEHHKLGSLDPTSAIEEIACPDYSTPAPCLSKIPRSSTPTDSSCHRYRLSLAGLYITLVASFVLFNFRIATHYTPRYRLDSAFKPNTQAEVVISMYQESTASVASLISSLQGIPSLASAAMHIYIKDERANATRLQLLTGASNVTHLPNTGRESGTYLHHIIQNWDSLARHTLFVQAEVHNKAEFLWRLETYFDPERTGMLDLGFRGHSYPCTGTDQWGWSDDSRVISRLFNEVYQTPCRPFTLSYKGQLLVSASRIRGIRKSVYEDLHQTLQEPASWAHSEPYVRGRADSMSAPVFGYTVERLWATIFQCSDAAIAWQCPSFLGRLWVTTNRTDCQCLD